MKLLKNLLFAAVAGIAGLGFAAPASAQTEFPVIFLADRGATVASPQAGIAAGLALLDTGDGWLLNGAIPGVVADDSNFSGLASIGIPDGKGIALTEAGGGDSDYFYIFHNVVFWDSDGVLSNPVDPSKFLHVPETGKLQDFSAFFGLGPGNTIAISSALDVPEPATWALMIGGFGMIGAALRRRRLAVAA